MAKKRKTGIKDIDGKMIYAGDTVFWPNKTGEKCIVTYVGEGGDMDWAADLPDDEPGYWLDNGCKVV